MSELRSMHWAEVRRLADGGDAAATRHLASCNEGTGLVRGALAALGYRYTGTGGWWISAFAAPSGMLGLVNTAKGIAVETDVALSAEVIMACTTPDQGEGQVSSGAAAWTSPDAGEPHRRSAPDGWVQLLVDVRESVRDGVVTPEMRVAARVIAWGLPTCYDGARGTPGHDALDPEPGAVMIEPEAWPWDSERRERTHRVGVAWLDGLARRMAEMVGIGGPVASALDSRRAEEPTLPDRDIGAAIRAVGRSEPGVYTPGGALFGAANRTTSPVIAQALRDCGVTRVADLCGDIWTDRVVGLRYYDIIGALVERLLLVRLLPVAETTWSAYEPMVPTPRRDRDKMYSSDWWLSHATMEPILQPIAAHYVALMMQPYADEARSCADEMIASYLGGQPIAVDIVPRPRKGADA